VKLVGVVIANQNEASATLFRKLRSYTTDSVRVLGRRKIVIGKAGILEQNKRCQNGYGPKPAPILDPRGTPANRGAEGHQLQHHNPRNRSDAACTG
jgi:hypothetical protein